MISINYNINQLIMHDPNVALIGKQQLNKERQLLEIKPGNSSNIYNLMQTNKFGLIRRHGLLKHDTYDKNGNFTMTIQIQDLKVNTGIPDSEFVFEIPSEAKIIDPV